MANVDELFEKCDIDDLKRGYTIDRTSEDFVCLICGKRFALDEVFPENGRFYTAESTIRKHISNEHCSPLKYLLSLDKKSSGISEQQAMMMELITQGVSDKEIAEKIGGITESTVRNHRFNLREKAKQARVFLAIMSSFEDYIQEKKRFVSIQRYAGNIDARYEVTAEEDEKAVKRFMNDQMQIIHYPKKEKDRLSLLRKIMSKFEAGRKYNENEVNDILRPIYEDFVLLRRLLIEYKFLDRTDDCREYWVK